MYPRSVAGSLIVKQNPVDVKRRQLASWRGRTVARWNGQPVSCPVSRWLHRWAASDSRHLRLGLHISAGYGLQQEERLAPCLRVEQADLPYEGGAAYARTPSHT
jgi:hypothetical protein